MIIAMFAAVAVALCVVALLVGRQRRRPDREAFENPKSANAARKSPTPERSRMAQRLDELARRQKPSWLGRANQTRVCRDCGCPIEFEDRCFQCRGHG